jgi:hypothetical protein
MSVWTFLISRDKKIIFRLSLDIDIQSTVVCLLAACTVTREFAHSFRSLVCFVRFTLVEWWDGSLPVGVTESSAESNMIKTTFMIFGVNKAALLGVRLADLPGCAQDGGKIQGSSHRISLCSGYF